MATIIGATCGKSKRKQDDEYLTERIEDAYQKHGGKYGSPRIHAERDPHRGFIAEGNVLHG
jgi:hypothetical protein